MDMGKFLLLNRKIENWRVLFGVVLAVILVLVPVIAGNLGASPNSLDFDGDNKDPGDDTNEKSLEITNNLDINLTKSDFDFEFELHDDFDDLEFDEDDFADFNFPDELNVSESATIDVKFALPCGFDAVDEDLIEDSFKLGELIIKADENEASPVDIKLQVDNQLGIKSIKMEIDGDEETVTEDDTVEVKTSDEISFIVKFENNFDEVKFKEGDVKVRIDIDDVGDKGEESGNNLESGDDDDISVGFSFDDGDDGTHEVILELEGTDEHGGLHGRKVIFDLKIVKSDDSNPDSNSNVDSDGDGVPDNLDNCPLDHVPGCIVEVDGCDIDTDQDGICNGLDNVPNGKNNVQEESSKEKEVLSNIKEEKTEEKVESVKEKGESDSGSIVSFILGVVVGIIIGGLFFILTKV